MHLAALLRNLQTRLSTLVRFPKHTLITKALPRKKNVDIKLVNCDLSEEDAAKTVTITFSGSNLATGGQADELGTSGDTGTVIKMSTAAGDFVKFDGATPAGKYNLKAGDNTMRYSAWVQKAASGTLKEGDFSAVANFNLAYK